MKLVFAVDKISYNDKDHIGVVKKVEAQMRLFEKSGIKTILCQYVWEGGYPQITIEKDTDVLYFRRIEFSVKLILKFRQLKKINPNLRIIMEIPTYPFEEEEMNHISFKRKLNMWLGEWLLKYYIDRIVLLAQEPPIEMLYGIPVICAHNGIEFDRIKERTCRQELGTADEIHLLCVSGCFFWHGYDRIIEALNLYYQDYNGDEKVFLHVVGEGNCLKEYVELSEKYGLLDEVVFFYGRKVGKELDNLFDKCDIALDCFGAHRKGLTLSSSLKTREYAAKGLPIVTSVALDICNEDTNKYILMLPSGEVPLDVKDIINFYHAIYDGIDKQKVACDIRNKFYPYCDWNIVYKPIVKYIVEEC